MVGSYLRLMLIELIIYPRSLNIRVGVVGDDNQQNKKFLNTHLVTVE